MTSAKPPGWPADLPPVGEGFAEQVVAWLLDRLPPEYRTSSLRKHPLILAMAAKQHSEATMSGTRDVYRNLRSELRDYLGQSEIDAGLVALESLASTFSRSHREVVLVEQALRGRIWKPRL